MRQFLGNGCCEVMKYVKEKNHFLFNLLLVKEAIIQHQAKQAD